ncbi:MAG: response regulator [Phormidesmis sp.]
MSNQLPTQSDANDGSILIVDDQSENLRSLFEALSCEGYKLRVLGSEQALQVAPLDPPDLILLSIQMSEIDGYEVCRRLKADSKTQRIPVIFLGALAGSIDKEKVFGGGGADYIAQPFQVLEVLARVDHQIRLRRLQQKDAQQRRQLQVRS